MDTNGDIEIMAPAGGFESLQAAIQAGADAVYFGAEQLNMRARAANNFTIEDLPKIAAIAKEHALKTYLTLNVVLYDQDLGVMRRLLRAAKEAGITAAIASDISAIQAAKEMGIEVHISTQANVSNIEAVKFYAAFADVVVLARELTLSQIKAVADEIVKQNIKGPSGRLLRIELFAHGALCVAISGKCYMSLATYNASANRGACLQNCRRSYRVTDEETGDELVIDNNYVLSPKDLCTIGFLDRLIGAGVSVFKIEGRGRKADYVYATTKAYKEAVLAVRNGTYTTEKVKGWMQELGKVYNRGFWEGGYYLGKRLGEWSGSYGSQATTEKIYAGKAINYFAKPMIAEFYLESGELKIGDAIAITGPTTGIISATVEGIRVGDRNAEKAEKGQSITIPIAETVRKNDKLFVVVKRGKANA
ncbi:TPA: U32 family peptidase [Candidatus Woesearchaeota archaeon]|nr:U32 family peptidase [Candidatus Woesearchaeota archaeon]HII68632.1 U32 family peptidase [Candidatus Woesearchaeota archaeon]